MPFARIRGANLFFTDQGAGTHPILFVHGYACDSHDWSWQLCHFAESHRVIALDLRGHGHSSSPPDGYDLRSLVADISELLDQIGAGPVFAFGHSFGGALVALLAVERPELVTAIVTIDPGYLLPTEAGPLLAEQAIAYQRDAPQDVALRIFSNGYHVAATPPPLMVWHNRRTLALPEHVGRQTILGLIGGGRPFALRANSEPILRKIKCPVLTLYADSGRVAITSQLFPPPSQTYSFDGAGHWLHQERPTETNVIISDWLRGLT
jgi:pimeloyl-ACP methyl ester carboxylesterase